MGVTGGEPLGFNLGAQGPGGTLPGIDLVRQHFYVYQLYITSPPLTCEQLLASGMFCVSSQCCTCLIIEVTTSIRTF